MKSLLLCFAFLLPGVSLAQSYQGEIVEPQAEEERAQTPPPINLECNCPPAPQPEVQKEEELSPAQEDRLKLEKEQVQLPGQDNSQYVDPVQQEMERDRE